MKFLINKNILKLYVAVFASALVMNSCEKKLDLSPITSFTSSNVWSSSSGAFGVLMGVYRGNILYNSQNIEQTPTDWWSYLGLVGNDLATDNAYCRAGEANAWTTLSNGNITPANAFASALWASSYQRIAAANYFLENVSLAPIDSATANRWKAEARFIRAAQYFYLSQFYGNVPLVLHTLTTDSANHVYKTSRDSVIAFAESEFSTIANYLPRQSLLLASETGRATRQAALAFLGRLQLGHQEFTKAVNTYAAIMAYGDNIIDPNFPSLFNGTNVNSKEIIFSTQYQATTASDPICQQFFPNICGGYSYFDPLGSLVENFDFNDGTPFSYTDPRYNPINLQQNRDPRLSYTVMYNGQTFAGLAYVCHPDSAKSGDQLSTTKQSTKTGYLINKYMNPSVYTSGNINNSGICIPVVRYSEILLSYLEANLEAGNTITQSLLDQTINAVRSRATVNMPPITVIKADALRPMLRSERRNELAFEGLRYWDLLRWGTIAQTLTGDFYGAPFPGAKNLRIKPGGVKDPNSRWYVTTKNYSAGSAGNPFFPYWPIPQSEININPNLGK